MGQCLGGTEQSAQGVIELNKLLTVAMFLLWLTIAFFTAIAAHADPVHHQEKFYQQRDCTAWGGEMEVKVPNDPTPSSPARIDCLLPNHAVEFDFGDKWGECVGQALNYAGKTNKSPACALIIENEAREWQYIVRLYDAVAATRRNDFIIFIVRP